MLLERLTYADDFPLNISIVNMVEDPLHYHLDIEILYVLKGSVRLKNGYCSYDLHEGDIFTNSGHEVHSMTALDGENVVAQIQISTRYFSRYFPNLSRACYRTYSKTQNDRKHDRLRDLLLQVLLKYTLHSFNYKSECTYLLVDVIKHLDQHFNLFAFDKDVVVGFDRGNQVAVERISRICQYIYQYYANNITLEDISQMEHLSSFYLSHLIKSFTGMSFRNILCFARVEWSEIKLLDSDSKISQIARDVGFSTTAYYEKYFEKWFKRTPQEHRQYYLPQVKSDLRPLICQMLPQNKAAIIIKNIHASCHIKKDSAPVIRRVNLEVNADINAAALFSLDKRMAVKITLEDYAALRYDLLSELAGLSPDKVMLLKREGDAPEQLRSLHKLLDGAGFSVETHKYQESRRACSAACDSIAYGVHILCKYLKSSEGIIELFLRDTDGDRFLQGQDAALTAAGIRKPVYYAYQLLSRIKGEVIAYGNQYCVIRSGAKERPNVTVLVYNTSESIQGLCTEPCSCEQAKLAINDFNDEVNVGVAINAEPGQYAVLKHGISRESNIFSYLAAVDFRDDAVAPFLHLTTLSGPSGVEVYTEHVRTLMNINLSVKGVGMQMASIRPQEELR